MKPLPLALIAAMISVFGAEAACPSLPDDAASRYVENGTALTLCLQDDLRRHTDAAAMAARIEATLGSMAIEIERQRQQMLAAQGTPGWP